MRERASAQLIKRFIKRTAETKSKFFFALSVLCRPIFCVENPERAHTAGSRRQLKATNDDRR